MHYLLIDVCAYLLMYIFMYFVICIFVSIMIYTCRPRDRGRAGLGNGDITTNDIGNRNNVYEKFNVDMANDNHDSNG